MCSTQVSSLAVSHVEDGRTRHGRCSAPQGAPASCFPPARGALGEAGAGNGPPPQRAAGGGAERGGGARDVGLRPQKTPPLGTRPAALRELGLQLVVEHAARPRSSGVPPQFLVAQALLESEQKALAVKEEEELKAVLASNG